MLGASGVQIQENNMDNLKLTREEDRESETVDPQCLLGSEMLVGLDHKILGSTLVEVILVKEHEFPIIVKVRPIDFHLYPTSVNTLPVDIGWSRDPIVLGIA
ncbi:hypothetical protein Tco_1406678 [Tanacetum coccineum]